MSEHSELIERAFVGYLTTLEDPDWQEDLTSDENGNRIFAGMNHLEKDGARIVVYCDGELQEDPPFSGNRWADVVIELKTPVQDDGGASIANHELNSDALENAIIADGLIAALNTTTGIYFYGITERNPFSDQDAMAHTNGYRLRVYSCQS